MSEPKWKCLECGKEFTVGDWTCKDGISNHVVAAKTYRTLDAPQEPGRYLGMPPIVRGKTMVCNVPPPKKVIRNGDTFLEGEGSVEFVNGIYTTADPVQQYWLDKKPAYNATAEQWKGAWWTREEKLADQETQLRIGQERLENERNELLATVKSKAAR